MRVTVPLTPGSVHVVEADIPTSFHGPGTTASWTFAVGNGAAPPPEAVSVEVSGFARGFCFVENDRDCSDDSPSLSSSSLTRVCWERSEVPSRSERQAAVPLGSGEDRIKQQAADDRIGSVVDGKPNKGIVNMDRECDPRAHSR